MSGPPELGSLSIARYISRSCGFVREAPGGKPTLTKINHPLHSQINSTSNSRCKYTMSASITTDVSNYEGRGFGGQSHTMKALTWQGKNSVKVGQSFCISRPTLLFAHFKINSTFLLMHFVIVDTARPKIIDEGDVILKVTGSTICGSDLHLFHGMSWP